MMTALVAIISNFDQRLPRGQTTGSDACGLELHYDPMEMTFGLLNLLCYLCH